MESDLISRSAVLDILSNEFDMAAEERAEADNEKDRAFNAGEIHCARRSTTRVEELPAIDAVPVVHGHIVWKDRRRGGVRKVTGLDEFGVEHTVRYMESYVERTPYCSVCTKVLGDALTYCPNCGAKMDAEGDR